MDELHDCHVSGCPWDPQAALPKAHWNSGFLGPWQGDRQAPGAPASTSQDMHLRHILLPKYTDPNPTCDTQHSWPKQYSSEVISSRFLDWTFESLADGSKLDGLSPQDSSSKIFLQDKTLVDPSGSVCFQWALVPIKKWNKAFLIHFSLTWFIIPDFFTPASAIQMTV